MKDNTRHFFSALKEQSSTCLKDKSSTYLPVLVIFAFIGTHALASLHKLSNAPAEQSKPSILHEPAHPIPVSDLSSFHNDNDTVYVELPEDHIKAMEKVKVTSRAELGSQRAKSVSIKSKVKSDNRSLANPLDRKWVNCQPWRLLVQGSGHVQECDLE